MMRTLLFHDRLKKGFKRVRKDKALFWWAFRHIRDELILYLYMSLDLEFLEIQDDC